MPPFDGLVDDLVTQQVRQLTEDSLCRRDHLAAVQPQIGHGPAEPALDDGQRALPHLLARGLDRAAGDVGLPGRGRRPAAAHLGVLGRRDDLVDAELGTHDLLLDGDQSLADLGRRGVHGRGHGPGQHLELDPGRGVVVEALGEPDVLVGHRVADAAHHALAVGGVGHAAGQIPQVRLAVRAARRRQRHGLHPAQQFLDWRRAVDDLPGRRLRALGHRVAAAQLDRVQAQRGRQLVHLGLVGERGLHRAETPHGPARRVVGVRAVRVDVHVGHHVGPDAHRARVPDHGRGAGRVRPAVQVDLRLDVHQPAVPVGPVLEAHQRRVPVHVPEERLLPVVDHLHRLAGAQGQQARVHVHGQVLPAAERATHAGQRQPHHLRRQAKRRADLPLVHVQPLGGDVQLHAAVLGRHRQPGLRAEEGLVLHAHPVLAGHHDVRHRLRVALAQFQVPHQVARRVQLGPLPGQLADLPRDRVHQVPPGVAQGLVGVSDRLVYLVFDLDPLGRLAGDLRVVGRYQRDWLALVAHDVHGQHRLVDDLQPVELVARHVLLGQHRGHARHGQRLGGFDGADPGVGMRAAQRGPPDHAVHPQVAGVDELPGDLGRAVRPARAAAHPAGYRGGPAGCGPRRGGRCRHQVTPERQTAGLPPGGPLP